MALTFNQKSWNDRKGYLGHTSENAFEVFCRKEGIAFEHFGFKDESSLNYAFIPTYVRTRPDYICQQNAETFFVEVKAVGRDGIIKIKHEGVIGMPFWNMLLPLKLFIYDSTRKKYSFFSFNLLKQKLTKDEPQRFEDNKLYFPVSITNFTWGML